MTERAFMESAEILALVLVALFVGALIAWLVYRLLKIRSEIILTAVMISPLIGYFALSGALHSVKAFDVFELEFRDVVKAPISDYARDEGADFPLRGDSESPRPHQHTIDAGDLVGSEAAEARPETLAMTGRSAPVILFRAEQWAGMTEADRLDHTMSIAQVMYNSMLDDVFLALVVVDDRNRPIGVFEQPYFLEILRTPLFHFRLPAQFRSHEPDPSAVRAQVIGSRLWDLLGNAKLRAEQEGKRSWLLQSTSRLESLRFLSKNKFNVLITVNDEGIYTGAISIDSISNRLLIDFLDLAG